MSTKAVCYFNVFIGSRGRGPDSVGYHLYYAKQVIPAKKPIGYIDRETARSFHLSHIRPNKSHRAYLT